MNDQRSAGPLRDNVVLIPKGLEPDLNGAFRHSGIFCDRADATVEGSRSPVGVDDQIQEKPDRSTHGMVMPRRRRDHKAPPNEPPPL